MSVEHVEIWSDDVREFLKVATRNSVFEFNAVSEAVINFVQQKYPDLELSVLRKKITANECRNRFASDYSSGKTQKSTEQNALVNNGGNESESLVQQSDGVLSNSSVPINTLQTKSLSKGSTIADENKTFDDYVADFERIEEANFKRKEIIFQNVLSSLRTEDSVEVEIPADVQEAVNLSRQTRERAKERKAKRASEELERKALEAQRESLRNRFAQDSLDSEGVDPLAHLTQDSKIAGKAFYLSIMIIYY